MVVAPLSLTLLVPAMGMRLHTDRADNGQLSSKLCKWGDCTVEGYMGLLKCICASILHVSCVHHPTVSPFGLTSPLLSSFAPNHVESSRIASLPGMSVIK